MHQLLVRHLSDKGAARFAVVRGSDQRSASAVTLIAPSEFAVEGNPGEHLAGGLRWYLEEFLDYPFPPRTERAERIRLALGAWGRQAFRALFGRGRAHAIYEEATSLGVTNLSLDIESEDPRILAWPWEALEDDTGACLGLAGQMTRRLQSRTETAPVSGDLPRDRINVLLVVARPFEPEMPNRSSSRLLVDLALEQELPVHIEVLRPPTFARLKRVLAERRGQFHALHFDGHAGHGAPISAPNGAGSTRPKPMPGQLVFEAEDGDPDPVHAAELSALLLEHGVPLVVLHACQAGTVRRPDEAFAAAAAALALGGVLNVVASGYSLYVSGARPFLPAFYRELFATGNVRRAARAGRQKMFEEPGRVCAVGTYQLADWLVPVAYQQAQGEDRPDFRFAQAAGAAAEDSVPLPDEAEDADNPYGLIGRDAA